MKASIFYKNQKGVASLLVLLIIGLTTIVIFQLSSLNQNPPIQPPSSSSKNPLVQTVSTQSATLQPKDPENLKKYLVVEAALLGVSDNISLYFKDLQQNSEVSLEPTKSWIPASTIKAYVLLEAFRQKRLGLINFDQEVTISGENTVPTELETDEFPRLREGTKATIKQLVEAMIIQSDNTAYNSLLDILDRRNINTSLRNIGITETVIGEKLNLDGGQFQKDLEVPGRQPNTTTVKDYAAFFSALYSRQTPDAEEILSILKRQKINNMIPAKLPDNIIIAHKTGDWAPIYHDGGIVYKPSGPFVFVAFTNSGDPAIVAKLAQVAYFQDPKYVGKSLASLPIPKKNLASLDRPLYYTNTPEQVLGVNTDNKFPDVTAEDLGITSKDLIPDTRQVNNIHSAWITPGSILYDVKKIFEDIQLQFSFNNTQKTKTYLSEANNRLSEIKSLLSKGNVKENDQLLSEAVNDIKNATNLAKDNPQKDILLIEIKKTKDLYYAVMADKAANVPDEQKAKFVDSVYNFYQKGKTEISPILNSSVIVNPTQQKPTIGIIDKVSGNQMTLKFDDGSKKQINLSSGTNVRSVDQDATQDLNTLKPGNKVAILGPGGGNNTINAQFVLNNIPQGLTDQHQGTVTSIDANKGVIKVIDQKGQINLVKVDENTKVKSKDTNVSLEGIKAGSQVVIFGITSSSVSSSSATPFPTPKASEQTTKPSPSNQPQVSPSGNTTVTSTKSKDNQVTTASPSPPNFNSNSPVRASISPSVFPTNEPKTSPKNETKSPTFSSKPITKPTTAGSSPTSNTIINTPAKSNPAPAATPTQTPSKPVVEIKATSVTVVGNSSGKDEQKQTQNSPKPVTPPTSAPSQPAPQPTKPEHSSSTPVIPTTPVSSNKNSSDDKKDSKK